MTIPIACSLDPEQLRERRANLLPGLIARASGITATENGYVLTFPIDVPLADITGVIDSERRCCPFFRFDLTLPAGGDPITLAITGPSGTKEFLDALTF